MKRNTIKILKILLVGAFCLWVLYVIFIPNIHVAPVRSQVSRVKSDMRSMAESVEAYYADNNAYPAHTTDRIFSINSHPTMGAARNRPSFRLATQPGQQSLTTPIAYQSTYYPDNFARPSEQQVFLTYCYYTDGDGWILWSPGPDRDYDMVPERDYTSSIPQPSAHLISTVTYDPTNGTISDGDIWRVKE